MGGLNGTGFTAGGAQMIYGNGDGTTFVEITGAEL
jgi:Zn-dependent metalloprotease